MSQKSGIKKIIHVPRMVLGRGARLRAAGGAGRGGIRLGRIRAANPPVSKKEQETDQLRAQMAGRVKDRRKKKSRSGAQSTREEEAAQLREQVKEELSWRFRACSHRAYECTLPVLPSRDYCARHILEDSSAPYRQCGHMYQSGRRCPLPAPLASVQANMDPGRRDQGLCFEHARASLAARQRSSAPPPPLTTTETLLSGLQHYVKPERQRTTSCASTVSVVSDPSDDSGAPHVAADPFKQIDTASVNTSVWSGLMDAASDSGSDADSVTLGRGGTSRAGGDEDLSGDEDTSYDRHPLRHAGVFTAEESVCEARTALRLLQAAYLRQMTRLRALLQASRARYLRALRHERDQHCSINAQARSGPQTARELRQLKKLKAYAGYHRRHGVDAVLARKLHHKRAKLGASGAPPRSQGRCSFAEGGVRCEAQGLPAARHCLKHIMQDRHQVLFAECGDRRAGVTCQVAVPRVSVHGLGCRYHADVPNYTVFALKKDDSGSDSDTNTASDEGEPADAAPLG